MPDIQSPNIHRVPGEVEAVRAKLLEGLTTVADFAAALERHERTIYAWIAQGMPVVRVGAKPFIPLNEARAWLLRPSGRNAAPRKPGRPRKAA